VARIYCFNDALFYLIIACMILFFTRRYDYAAAVLAAPVLIFGICFYSVDNLFLLGAVMLLYMAVYKYIKDGRVKNLILYPCLFFLIWSHPITLLVIAVFFAGLYKSREQALKDIWIFIFIAINVAIKFAMLDDYDSARMPVIGAHADLSYLPGTIITYCFRYWYLTLALYGLYRAVKKDKKWGDYLGLLMIPVILYFCSAHQYGISDPYFLKYTFPINLFLLTEGVLLLSAYQGSSKKVVLLFTGLVLLSGIKTTIFENHSEALRQVKLLDTLLYMCYNEDHAQSKWYVNDNSLKEFGSLSTNLESMTYSEYDKLPITIQVVKEKDSLKKAVYATPEDAFYLNEDLSYPAKQSLSPYYFHFKEGPYRELVLDSAKLRILRKAGR